MSNYCFTVTLSKMWPHLTSIRGNLWKCKKTLKQNGNEGLHSKSISCHQYFIVSALLLFSFPSFVQTLCFPSNWGSVLSTHFFPPSLCGTSMSFACDPFHSDLSNECFIFMLFLLIVVSSPVASTGSRRAESTPTSEKWLSPSTLTGRWTFMATKPLPPTEAESCTRTPPICTQCRTLPTRPWRGAPRTPASSFRVRLFHAVERHKLQRLMCRVLMCRTVCVSVFVVKFVSNSNTEGNN